MGIGLPIQGTPRVRFRGRGEAFAVMNKMGCGLNRPMGLIEFRAATYHEEDC